MDKSKIAVKIKYQMIQSTTLKINSYREETDLVCFITSCACLKKF